MSKLGSILRLTSPLWVAAAALAARELRPAAIPSDPGSASQAKAAVLGGARALSLVLRAQDGLGTWRIDPQASRARVQASSGAWESVEIRGTFVSNLSGVELDLKLGHGDGQSATLLWRAGANARRQARVQGVWIATLGRGDLFWTRSKGARVVAQGVLETVRKEGPQRLALDLELSTTPAASGAGKDPHRPPGERPQ